MLNHTRRNFIQWKFAGWKGLEVEPRSHPEKLVEIYKVMSEELPRTSKVPKSCHERSKCRRVALPRTHIKKRKSPEQESDDDSAAWSQDAQPVILDTPDPLPNKKVAAKSECKSKAKATKTKDKPVANFDEVLKELPAGAVQDFQQGRTSYTIHPPEDCTSMSSIQVRLAKHAFYITNVFEKRFACVKAFDNTGVLTKKTLNARDALHLSRKSTNPEIAWGIAQMVAGWPDQRAKRV